MKRSADHILTTHTGSLPRPADLGAMLVALDAGESIDRAAFDARVCAAVAEVVQKQATIGVDVLNDGESGKVGYATYVKDRLSGFGGESAGAIPRAEAQDFPEWSRRPGPGGAALVKRPACDGPIAWQDFAAVQRDLDNLAAAVASVQAAEVFMTAASPGVISAFLADQYFHNHDHSLEALAATMKDEYHAIHNAGFLLQLDCPDLTMGRRSRYGDLSDRDYRSLVARHVDVINEATKDIPADRMRMHLCWGNYEGPHHLDVPLKEIVDIVLTARPAGLSFEGANPRHEHEWAIWKEVKLPPGKVIIPGVIDTTTNFVEHPELVAQRIVRYAEVVGKENVIAGTDCGLATFATTTTLDARVAWAKLQAMVDGARLASEQLWR